MKINTILLIGILFLTGQVFAMTNSDFDKKMTSIVEHYLVIHDKLAADRTDNVMNMAIKIQDKAKMLDVNIEEDAMNVKYQGIPEDIVKYSSQLMKAGDIDEMRESFKELSKPIAKWASINGPEDLNVVYCSMAPGSWLQKGEEVRNPYYGINMLRCGEIVKENKGKEMNNHGMDHKCMNCDQNCNHHEKDNHKEVEHKKHKM